MKTGIEITFTKEGKVVTTVFLHGKIAKTYVQEPDQAESTILFLTDLLNGYATAGNTDAKAN